MVKLTGRHTGIVTAVGCDPPKTIRPRNACRYMILLRRILACSQNLRSSYSHNVAWLPVQSVKYVAQRWDSDLGYCACWHNHATFNLLLLVREDSLAGHARALAR